ncbi:MAG: tetratricopeptide repeat protein [Armatimonadota bacterium]
MECANCGITNDPDSRYCKKCGHMLVANSHRSLTPEEHIKIGELIYAAYKHKEAGEIESAILACQGALALNDTNASAHSLLGSLYELKGDIHAALSEYEYAAKLAPENDGYRRKLEALKSGYLQTGSLSSRSGIVDRLMPYWPVLAALTSVFLVLFVCLVFILGQEKKPAGKPEVVSQKTESQAGPVQSIPGQPYWQPQYPVPRNNYTGQQPSQNRNQTLSNSQQYQQQHSPANNGNLTQRSGPSERNTPALQPLPVENPSERSGETKSQPVITPVVENDSTSSHNTSPTSTSSATRPATPTVATSTGDGSSKNLPSDALQRATTLQQNGRYHEAISAYKEALNTATDSGYVYQQLAICYQRVNQHDQAIENFNRAINSYRDQVRAGRDPGDVQRAIRACENGIQVSRNLKK